MTKAGNVNWNNDDTVAVTAKVPYTCTYQTGSNTKCFTWSTTFTASGIPPANTASWGAGTISGPAQVDC